MREVSKLISITWIEQPAPSTHRNKPEIKDCQMYIVQSNKNRGKTVHPQRKATKRMTQIITRKCESRKDHIRGKITHVKFRQNFFF